MERWTPAYHRLFDRDYELNGGEPFCRTMAWLWLCHHAQFEDGTRIVRDEMLTLKRGEILCSLRHLADKWGWSVKRVRTFLSYLQDCGKLGTVKVTAQGTVFRLLFYERWRGGGTGKGTAKGTVGAQGIEGIEDNTRYAREADVVEKGSGSSGPLSEFGVPPEAIAAAYSLEGFDDVGDESGMLAQWGPSGTLGERIWDNVQPERIPALIGASLTRTAKDSKDGKWSLRFFGFKLKSVIEDELAPTPAAQAKARNRLTPAGKVTAEAEAEREHRKREEAKRARERSRREAEARETEAEEARAREAYRWLQEQDEEVRADVEREALGGLRQLGFQEPPAAMVRAYVVQVIEARQPLAAPKLLRGDL